MTDAEPTCGPGRVEVARVYDERGPDSALHVLVDRLWPRGIHKQDPRIDEWWKSLAPSTDLRRWYGHDPAKFEEFAQRYASELESPESATDLDRAQREITERGLVLLTATKDLSLAQTTVLRSVLISALDQPPR